MNKKLRINEAVLLEVLAVLGYREDYSSRVAMHHTYEQHWRRQYFHLIIRAHGENMLRLTLHRDACVPYPPGHRAVFMGKDVTAEFHKILAAYYTRMKGRVPERGPKPIRIVSSGGVT